MTNNSIASLIIGASAAILVARAISRFTTKGDCPALPFTTPTNPILLSETSADRNSDPASHSQRLQQLVQSGALTQDEYLTLTNSTTTPDSDNARLSILHGSPNKIQDIKSLRTHFKLGLRDAKDIVDNLPQTFLAPMPYAKAAAIAHQLQSTGMTTHIS